MVSPLYIQFAEMVSTMFAVEDKFEIKLAFHYRCIPRLTNVKNFELHYLFGL